MAAGIHLDIWAEIARRHGHDVAEEIAATLKLIGTAGKIPPTAYLYLMAEQGVRFELAMREVPHAPTYRARNLKLVMYDAALDRWRELINAE